MNSQQKAILPGILLSSLLLIFLNKLVNQPTRVVAAAEGRPSIGAKSQDEQSLNTEVSEPDPACRYLNRYPAEVQTWCGIIEESASIYGVDPLLVAAVMLVESGGQPEVISHSGAVGLMQVMPRDGIASTFQCINGPCFVNRPSISELKEPAFNIDYGVRMLAGLTEREGNLRDALRAYGPMNVGYTYADKVLTIHSSFYGKG